MKLGRQNKNCHGNLQSKKEKRRELESICDSIAGSMDSTGFHAHKPSTIQPNFEDREAADKGVFH